MSMTPCERCDQLRELLAEAVAWLRALGAEGGGVDAIEAAADRPAEPQADCSNAGYARVAVVRTPDGWTAETGEACDDPNAAVIDPPSLPTEDDDGPEAGRSWPEDRGDV